MIRVSAPAKVHLIGEHAVVYNKPAIMAAVGRRIYVDAAESDKVVLKDERFKSRREWSVEETLSVANNAQEYLSRAAAAGNYSELLAWAKDGGTYNTYWKALLGTVLKMTGADAGISVHITKCDIPTGSGLGSSSAAAVAMTKAASEVYERDLTIERINEIAYECERLVHGTPSGGDNTTSCYGGLVWFQKAQPKNIMQSLREEIPYKLENFVLAYTKQPEKSTGELIQMVRNISENERNPKMDEIERMTYEMKEVLKRKDYDRMKAIMNRTNDILTSFGLSIPETEK
ncbi:MAG: mevalonate kinase, partial [Candidatus Aenigmarchaeota archaeon]|nr:mevalonate kinase [Candidatus Aenigmarchaeota archaeon]